MVDVVVVRLNSSNLIYYLSPNCMEFAKNDLVVIDSENGITIDDCERVSRALDIPLDENDVTDGKSYNFNVSSYGLDRAFKTDYDFNKHIDKMVDIKFYAPFNNKKSITTKLLAFDKDTIQVLENDKTITIERKLIANICAHIEF